MEGVTEGGRVRGRGRNAVSWDGGNGMETECRGGVKSRERSGTFPDSWVHFSVSNQQEERWSGHFRVDKQDSDF